MTTIDLKQAPYFDDFTEGKKFYQILFRPGRAVQARELNQIQSQIKSQLDKFGKHIFKNGTQVLPGSSEGVKVINNIGFIKIQSSASTFTDTEQNIQTYWLNKKIISTSGESGITANVVGYKVADSLGEVRLFVNYISAGTTTGTSSKFSNGQDIQTVEVSPLNATISGNDYSTGIVQSVTVEESVYFYNGRFILVDAQTVFVEPTQELLDTPEAWDAYRSAKVGLKFVESVVQWTQDDSLLDNATGTPNIGAPGADRLYIEATLKQLDLNSDEESFSELVKIVDGNVQKKVINTEYSVLDDYLAKRTFDESGDYTVIPFQIQIKEFLRTAEQDGVHVEEEFQFDTLDLARLSSVLVFGLATPGQAFQRNGKWMPGTSYDDVNDSTSFTNMVNERLSIIVDPGRAYVKGYRIEKASTSVVDFKKARTTKFRNNKFVETPLGTYVFVKNVNGVLSTNSYDDVILNDDLTAGAPSAIGTARALTIEYFSGFYDAAQSNLDDNRQYRLFLFDIKLNDGQSFSNVRSISSINPTFSCDTVLDSFRLTGSVSRDSVDNNIINGTGTSWRNDEVDRLSAGDLIEVNAGNTTSKIYEVASNPENDNELVILGDHSSDTWPDNSKIDYLYASLRTNSTNAGLVYKMPDNYVKTVRGADSTGAVDSNSIDTIYTVRRIDTGQTATANLISLNAGTDQEFESFSFNAYSVVKESDGTWLQVLPYSLGNPSARTCEIKPLGSSLEVHLNGSDTGNFTIYSSVVKPGGTVSRERAKVLNLGSFDSGGVYQGAGFAVSEGSDVSEISLGRADVLRITRIVEGPEGYSQEPSNNETLPAGHKDITGLYILDDGQRDYYYDIAKVRLRAGSERPRGRVRVEFDYFTHNSTNGDYFSVDSYPFSGSSPSMDYSDVPDFTSSDGTLYPLTDCFDFRPVVNSGGIDAGFATLMAVPKDDIRSDYHFYLPRRDKLFLDKTGKFLMKTGNPDENPLFPDDPDSGMTLYELSITPYTTSEKAVFPVMRDNKRYTMRDIGKIERRVSNIEYYTSLSMLEKDTNSLVIPDALGNDRFKNGFLVDNFKTFNASDLGSADFRCSLDRREGILRPLIQEDAVSLFERALMDSNPASFRTTKNYQKTGQLYTLPYTPVTMIEQTKASKSINVNPYAVFSYVGAVSISPWTDEWRETSYAEPLNVQDQGSWEATRQQYGPSGTKVDYQSTSQRWISTVTETTKTGNEILEVAGHRVISQLKSDSSWLKSKMDRSLFRSGYVRVPEGYANAGKIIPVGRNSWVSNETRTTVTQIGKEITTDYTSTFVDLGFSAPVSMGSRIIDTSLIEFMRSKDVAFTGKAFKPNIRLYPFFDGVDVSAYCTPQGGALGDPLICDSKGRIQGTFSIPNTDELRFKTGDRIFRLTTSSANILIPAPDSAGDAKYTARGWIDTKQETTYSTRLFKIDRDKVESEKDISMVTSEVLGSDNPCPRDPIAQSFFVYEKGGCFITSVDVFFRTRPTGTDQAPIIFQIRELGDQGLPSDRILPFGEIIKEAVEIVTNEVNITTGEMTINGNPNTDPKAPATNHTSGPWTNGEYDANGEINNGVSFLYENAPTTYMVPTRFTFESPIYLAENKSYCFVLMADSLDYNVWTAQAGPDVDVADPEERIVNVEIGTTIPIETDPYFQGVLFKSQNGLTWTPDQTSDVKFKIWKADFDTAVNGEVDFVNDELPLRLLTLDPLDFSNGSSYVRIHHPNHGHTTARVAPASGNASKVVFSPQYDSQLPGEVTSSGTTVTTTGNFNDGSIVAGSFIINPHNGEQKRVVSIDSDTQLTIASAFDSQNELDEDVNVIATSYVVPSGASLAGIDAEVFYDYAGHDVEYTELDYYRVDLGTNATASGRFGGNRIFATENKRFEEMTLITTPLEIPETQISWNVRTTSGAGVHNSTNSTYIQQPRANFLCNEKLVFQNPMLVGSYVNELPVPQGPSTGNTAADRKSLAVRAILSSANRNISPVLDESRMTAYLVSHRMDNPHGIAGEGVDSASIINAEFDNYQVLTTTNIPAVSDTANKLYFTQSSDTLSGVSGIAGSRILTASSGGFLANIRVGDTVKTEQGDERVVESVIDDTELLLDLALSSSMTLGTLLYINPQNTKIKSSDASVAKHLSTLDVGKYLTVSGTANTGERDFSDSRIVRVTYTPNNTVIDTDFLVHAPRLIEVEVEYKNLVLSGEDSSSSIIVTQKDRFIDEISPNAGSAGAKYVSKTLTVTRPSNALKVMFDASRDETCEIELYYKLQLENTTDSLDTVNWTKAEFNVDVNGELIPLTPAPNLSTGSFSEYSSTLSGLPSFVAAQTKIVMLGGNPARAPRIINFRMIVLDE